MSDLSARLGGSSSSRSSTGLDSMLTIGESIYVDVDRLTAIVPGREEISSDSLRTLKQMLTMELYAAFHAGGPMVSDVETRSSFREADVELLLSEAVPHQMTLSQGLLVGSDEEVARIRFPEATIAVPKEQIRSSGARTGEIVDVDVPARRPALSNGFYMIDGPVPPWMSSARSSRTRRYYVHTKSPEASASVWRETLQAFNDRGIAYRSKALSHRWGYPRRDAVVFYVPNEYEEAAAEILRAQLSRSAFVEPETSHFAEIVIPGVGAADEPYDPRVGYRDLSFGEHRSSALAAAVLGAAKDHRPLRDCLSEALRNSGIDLLNPSRNLTSETPEA